MRKIRVGSLMISLIVLLLTGCNSETEVVSETSKIEVEEKSVENVSFNMTIEHVEVLENGGMIYFTPATVLNEHQNEFLSSYMKWTDSYIKNNNIKIKKGLDQKWIYVLVSDNDLYIIKSLAKYCNSMIITLETERELSRYSFFDHNENVVTCHSRDEADRFVKKRSAKEIDFDEMMKLYGQDIVIDEQSSKRNDIERKITLNTAIDDAYGGDIYIYYASSDEEYRFLKNYFRSPHRVTGMYIVENGIYERFILVWYNMPKVTEVIDEPVTDFEVMTDES